jgi:hypothetical protein
MRIPIQTYRTHNRNRSLSFINSDQLVNVNKGSRQINPVILGKRMALIVEHQVSLVTREYHGLCSSLLRTVRERRPSNFQSTCGLDFISPC